MSDGKLDIDKLLGRPASVEVTYTRAEKRTDMGQFLNHVIQQMPTEKWEFGESYDEKSGWLVVWKVGNLAMAHPAKWAMAFIRNLADNRRRNNAERSQSFEDMLGDWDMWAKRCLEKNAKKVKPDIPPAQPEHPVTLH